MAELVTMIASAEELKDWVTRLDRATRPANPKIPESRISHWYETTQRFDRLPTTEHWSSGEDYIILAEETPQAGASQSEVVVIFYAPDKFNTDLLRGVWLSNLVAWAVASVEIDRGRSESREGRGNSREGGIGYEGGPSIRETGGLSREEWDAHWGKVWEDIYRLKEKAESDEGTGESREGAWMHAEFSPDQDSSDVDEKGNPIWPDGGSTSREGEYVPPWMQWTGHTVDEDNESV